jgi:Tol biopolymer transport system component
VAAPLFLYRTRLVATGGFGRSSLAACAHCAQTDGEFSVSSDGRYIVRVLAAPTPLGHTNEAHLYLYDLQAGTVRQLTSGPGADRWPAISPNDQTVAFTHTTYRKAEVFGAGAETTVTETVPLAGGPPQIVHETPGDRQPATLLGLQQQPSSKKAPVP